MLENKNHPFFSIIITTYNRADFLIRAIVSLLHQSEKDWEAIIVDDGSTDNSKVVIQPFLNHEKFSYIYQDNKGCVGAKNTGMNAAKGKYISFLDADDEYKPNHLSIRKSILLNHPQTDILHGGLQIMGNEFVPNMHHHGQLIHISNCVVGGTFFIKPAWVQRLNGFNNIPMGHDSDFFERAKKQGASILKTDAPTYIYHRDDENSMTNQLIKK